MDFEIRPMLACDTAGVENIEKECFSSPWKYDDLLYHAGNRDSHFLVAVKGEEIAGYIGVIETAGEAYITNIAVLPAFRRQGLAKALLNSAADGAKERECEFITLEVRESNFAAISLYEGAGFMKAGVRKNFYSSPAENALLYTLFFKE
ncbi:MAG: ribosomal protein S18-alanine N-acetyltransferase [Clostridia bacterium]|nr:ribosomal protein S18-alanine N-acetyltransferase [Clostridia bacterium]MBR6701930.1 ribosomal protein S18-alanine N-acetyltransferase [Clostridia bacterium]